MTCVHLQKLFRLCQEHDLKLSSSDLIHVVCNQCGAQEVCPSTLTDEYDAKQTHQVKAEFTAHQQRVDDCDASTSDSAADFADASSEFGC